MLRVLDTERLPGIEACWVQGLCITPGCGCARPSRLLAVAAPTADLWVCAGSVSDDYDPEELLEEIRGPGADMTVARAAAAFGLPWAQLTVPAMAGQVVLLMRAPEEVACELRSRSVEDLLALREWARSPADMARALRLVHDYRLSDQ